MKTALYRHFDTSGALLYVGVSLSAVARLAQHKQTAHWFEQLARVDVEWFDSRFEALEAEAIAITRELPRHNVQHARPPKGATVIAFPRVGPEYSFAIVHVVSGRRDGNYFDEADARDQLRWWVAEFPEEEFSLTAARCGDPSWPRGATDGALPLRPHQSDLWRASA